MGRKLAVFGLLFGASVLLSACHQNETVFAVDTTTDTVDANPGDGLCADAAGDCSLRAAVMEANALPGVELIQLVDFEAYQLTIGGPEDDIAAVGDLDITEGVVIQGKATISSPLGLPTLVHIQHPSGLVELDGPDFLRGSASVRLDGPGSASVIHATFFEASFEISGGTAWIWRSAFAGRHEALSTIVANGGTLDVQNVAIRDELDDFFTAPFIAVDDADVAIRHSTLSNSTTALVGLVGNGSVTVDRSILETDGTAPPCDTGVVSLGWNVTRGGTCGSPAATDTQTSTPAELSWVSVDGQFGAALPPFHPAVDSVADATCATAGRDMWTKIRPSGPNCDAGSHELQYGRCAEWWPGGDFEGCDLGGLTVGAGDLTGANFDNSTIRYVSGFAGTDLTNATFRNSTLTFARFYDVDLTGADFGGAMSDIFPGPVMVGSGIQGVPAVLPPGWGIAGGHIVGPDGNLPDGAPGVDFTGQGISMRDVFVEGSVVGADFSGLDLWHSTWYDVDFTDADFSGADLSQASLSSAGFSSGADTSFVGADLIQTSFLAVRLLRPDFTDADLTGARSISPTFTLTDPIFSNTICPSGVNSDANGGNCDGQY